MKLKKKKTPFLKLVLGQTFFIDGKEGYQVLCSIGHLNAGYGFLFPRFDDPENYSIATHICYAKIDAYGKVTLI